MADKDRRNDEEFSNFRRRKQSDVDDNSSDDMDATSDSPSGPDIGLGHTHRRGGEQKFGDSSSSDGSRREESGSFSFKHFLQGHGSSSTGARPKVYDNPRYDTKDSYNRRHVNTPELASVLPDFVQDHLVVEQCYLAADSTLDIDNLPDFALSGNADLDLPLDLGQRSSAHIAEQLPFDLTQLSSNNPGSSRLTTSPVDDSFRLPSNRSYRSMERTLPLDLAQSNVASGSSEPLPLDLAQGSGHARNVGTRPANENLPCDLGLGTAQAPLDLGAELTDNPTVQSLPDFLSDGPIQCRESDQGLPGPEIVEQDRGDEGQLRRNLAEMTRRCEALEVELRRCREAAHHREEALRRANSELAAVRRENSNLRQTLGETSHPDSRTPRVARELMAAATQAELSLRQLLSGVESLRLLASTLDQGPMGAAGPPPHAHASPRPSTSAHDYEPEDRAGPAL